MFEVTSTGSEDKLIAFLQGMRKGRPFEILEKYGKMGVNLLASATPVESGLTAESWRYEVEVDRNTHTISWHNTNIVDGIPVVILIQYGHGTRGGTYVSGVDFINPVIRPLFDEIVNEVWKGVTDG